MKYLTVAQTSSTIGVSRMTIYNWIKSGKIDFIKIEGRNNAVGYAIPYAAVRKIANDKTIVKEAIDRTFNEYGDVLDKLSDE